jgi:hypothetical protein
MKTSERIAILAKIWGGFLLVWAGLMWTIQLPGAPPFGVILAALGGGIFCDGASEPEKRNK